MCLCATTQAAPPLLRARAKGRQKARRQSPRAVPPTRAAPSTASGPAETPAGPSARRATRCRRSLRGSAAGQLRAGAEAGWEAGLPGWEGGPPAGDAGGARAPMYAWNACWSRWSAASGARAIIAVRRAAAPPPRRPPGGGAARQAIPRAWWNRGVDLLGGRLFFTPFYTTGPWQADPLARLSGRRRGLATGAVVCRATPLAARGGLPCLGARRMGSMVDHTPHRDSVRTARPATPGSRAAVASKPRRMLVQRRQLPAPPPLAELGDPHRDSIVTIASRPAPRHPPPASGGDWAGGNWAGGRAAP
jgi:hypothetical protein